MIGIDVVVDADHGDRQPVQHKNVGAVADDGAEHHQISYRADAAPAPGGRMRLREQRRHGEREPRRQLLHRAADHRMRLGLMPSLQDGAERPAGAADLQQQEAPQQRTAEAFVHRFGSDQQNRARQARPACPTMVGPCNRSPPGMSASTPIIQNGDTVMKTDASPLGTHCSAKTRQPVPVPMMMTP